MLAIVLAAAMTSQVPVYAEVRSGGNAVGRPLPGMRVVVTGPGGVLARGVTGSDGQIYPGLAAYRFAPGTALTLTVSDLLVTRTRSFPFAVPAPPPGRPVVPVPMQAYWDFNY